MQAVINADDDDLNGFPEDERPSAWQRFWGRVLAPIVPLANRVLRHRHDVEMARASRELAAERRKRKAAELEADAARQKAETLALMHARVIAMLEAETAVFHATKKAATDR